MAFQAPKLVQPAEGTYRKIDHSAGVGSYANSITFEWLPVATLENGKIRCSWKDQPSGIEAAIFDRYIVKFDQPLNSDKAPWDPRPPTDSFTDAGTQITVELFRFRSDVTYTWRVVVGRWCATITPGVNRDSFMSLISPYSESRTFRYSP
jgi:hypothetical protein